MSIEDQSLMVHRLPRARVVDRISYVRELARGRRVVHVGFADAGFRALQERSEAWLHAHLASVAREAVGIDLDEEAVADAVAEGFVAHRADCRDPAALAALGLASAELVVAGEVIEHLDDPGAFLEGLHALVDRSGRLVVTTPNAAGWLNPLAALANREINHPDHVATYTWRTLSTLLGRHRWLPTDVATYTSRVKPMPGASVGMRLASWGPRAVTAAERLAGRLGAPFVADGLIVVARPAPG